MGLIKALTGSVFSYISDMWEDYIYCDSLDNDVLVKKGKTRQSGGASSNADENVITNGSRIAVNAGQTLIVVENGQIIDFTSEQGGYQYVKGVEPTMFCGSLGEDMKVGIDRIKERFKFGGIPTNDQRVYFVNTKEIFDNRFGFGEVPYRDSEFDLTILIQGFGAFSFHITDPILFYENICGNVAEQYDKASIIGMMKAELQNEMLPVLGRLANSGLHYDQLPQHSDDILAILKENLSHKWKDERGIELMTVVFASILPDDDSMEKIRQMQESRVYSDNKAMLGARVGAASANAMESAAENPSGAANGFIGMNMARNTANIDVAQLMQDGGKPPVSGGSTWTCSCGMLNNMMFCPKCGSKRPESKKCPSCGFDFPPELSGMKFCPNCGKNTEE